MDPRIQIRIRIHTKMSWLATLVASDTLATLIRANIKARIRNKNVRKRMPVNAIIIHLQSVFTVYCTKIPFKIEILTSQEKQVFTFTFTHLLKWMRIQKYCFSQIKFTTNITDR
jgi:hypothetical protein